MRENFHASPAQLYFGGHILKENRTWLCAEFPRRIPIAVPEPAEVFYAPLQWCILVGLAGLRALAVFFGPQANWKGQYYRALIPRRWCAVLKSSA